MAEISNNESESKSYLMTLDVTDEDKASSVLLGEEATETGLVENVTEMVDLAGDGNETNWIDTAKDGTELISLLLGCDDQI